MTPTQLRALLAAALAAALAAPSVRADDLADEADLQFELGAQRYQAGDYRGALEHFLASNRLVPNRNVVFNIARSYEQLQRFPDAHRYYTQSLEAETDATARATIQAALARIAPFVAVLDVVTEPPGATIYIDRRDLGPRGDAPRALAFAPGRYTVIAELRGYEPARAEGVDARRGTRTPVRLALRRILGTVRVEGTPPGTAVRVGSEAAPVACAAPCAVELPPGRQTLFLTAEGWQTAAHDVEVVARETLTTRPRMLPRTGALVVNTDERDALIEVDGRPVGFTPAVVNAQVGPRRVRISMPGFRAVEREVTVRPDVQTRVDAQLRQVEEVEAASRATESVEDAPSSVTIVPSQELRAMAYPTIAESLRGVRGLHLSDDRTYETVGFRGLAPLGDYGNRVLVLLDGHPTNDNWISSSYIGFDARTDLEDVERIEVVRGPGSVLYGTGALSGVVNVVTRRRNAPTRAFFGVSTAYYGVARARAGFNLRLAPDAGVWLSVAGAHAAGRDFSFPELAAEADPPAPATDGSALGADGFDAGTLHGRAWYGPLTAQWFLHARRKRIPTGEYDTVVGDPRSVFTDTRGLFELRYEPRLAPTVRLLTRAHVNFYGFDGVLGRRYAEDREPGMEGQDLCVTVMGRPRCLLDYTQQEVYTGAWGGAEARVSWTPGTFLRLTGGVEGQRHFAATVTGEATPNPTRPGTTAGPGAPEPYLDERSPYSLVAGYALADWAPSSRVRVSAGTRFDAYFLSTCSRVGRADGCAAPGEQTRTFSAVSPRLAVVVRPYENGVLKVMGGRAFRAPSIYQLYYNDAGETQVPSPALAAESLYSGEVEFQHRFSTTWTALVAPYANYVDGLIVARGRGDATSPTNYVNSPSPVLAVGAEVEVRREWRQGWMFAANYSLQSVRYLPSGGVAAPGNVPNAPEHLASLRAAAPILSRALVAATRVTFEGPRWDRGTDSATGAGQRRTDPFMVWDLVFTGEAERFGLRYAVGVYNLFDWRYALPVSSELRQRTIAQNGRTFLASLSLTL